MIYSKRRRGGQRKYYTRRSFRVKRYKHYGGAWINDEDKESINELVYRLGRMNPGTGRIILENQLTTILRSIVNRAEQKNREVKEELDSINVMYRKIIGDENKLSDDDKARKAELRTLSTAKTKTLNEMRSNYQSALQYQKSILDKLK